MNKKEILEKIEKGTPLTDDEEIFYLTNILGYSEQQAKNILAIANNTDPNALVD